MRSGIQYGDVEGLVFVEGAHTHTHTHTRKHARTHAHTHTHPHTHTQSALTLAILLGLSLTALMTLFHRHTFLTHSIQSLKYR